jgi:hypothetical protein
MPVFAEFTRVYSEALTRWVPTREARRWHDGAGCTSN